MTHVDVRFRYSQQPGINQMQAIDAVRDVYGIRRIVFDEKDRTVLVEYDASRLNEAAVAALLRGAGVDIEEKIALA